MESKSVASTGKRVDSRITNGLFRVMERTCGLAIDLDDAKELVSRFIGSLFDRDSLKIELSRPTTHHAFLVYFSKKKGRSIEDVSKKCPMNEYVRGTSKEIASVEFGLGPLL